MNGQNHVPEFQVSASTSDLKDQGASDQRENPVRVALIGAGNIGSRHLQGLALARLPIQVDVIERNASAAALSDQRLSEALASSGKQNLAIRWHRDIANLPGQVDVAIVATGATFRREIVESLVNMSSVRFLVLEKFLFQRREGYSAIADLLSARGVKAFVNTPRRCWPSYRALVGTIPADLPIRLDVHISPSYGLATNAVHMVDLLGFLTLDRHPINLSGEGLVFAERGSRHSGIVEFDGTLAGFSERGDLFSMRASGSDADVPIRIEFGNTVLLVDEAAHTMRVVRVGADDEELYFPILFQSQLSGSVVDDLMLTQTCRLPGYELSSRYHLACMDAFMQAEERLTGTRPDLCRIT